MHQPVASASRARRSSTPSWRNLAKFTLAALNISMHPRRQLSVTLYTGSSSWEEEHGDHGAGSDPSNDFSDNRAAVTAVKSIAPVTPTLHIRHHDRVIAARELAGVFV